MYVLSHVVKRRQFRYFLDPLVLETSLGEQWGVLVFYECVKCVNVGGLVTTGAVTQVASHVL